MDNFFQRNLATISFILIVIGVSMALIVVVAGNQKFEKLAQQNHELSQQNKDLATQNRNLAQQGKNYTRCVATIFAQYTHDFVPVTILDLDTCTLDSSKATTAQPTEASGTSSQSQLKSQTGAKGVTGAQGPRSSQSPGTPTPPQSIVPGKTGCTFNLLGICI